MQLSNHLLEEEEKAKHVGKQRSRVEMQLIEQEQELKKEKQVNFHRQFFCVQFKKYCKLCLIFTLIETNFFKIRAEVERVKRKLEVEMEEQKELLEEKRNKLEELNFLLSKREEELTALLTKLLFLILGRECLIILSEAYSLLNFSQWSLNIFKR